MAPAEVATNASSLFFYYFRSNLVAVLGKAQACLLLRLVAIHTCIDELPSSRHESLEPFVMLQFRLWRPQAIQLHTAQLGRSSFPQNASLLTAAILGKFKPRRTLVKLKPRSSYCLRLLVASCSRSGLGGFPQASSSQLLWTIAFHSSATAQPSLSSSPPKSKPSTASLRGNSSTLQPG